MFRKVKRKLTTNKPVKKYRKQFDQFIDTVLSSGTETIFYPTSPHHNKDVWVLNCSASKVKVLPELLEDKEFFEDVRRGSVLGKKFVFTITRQGKYLLRAEERKDGE